MDPHQTASVRGEHQHSEIDGCCPGGSKQCCNEPDLKQEHGQGPAQERAEVRGRKLTLNVTAERITQPTQHYHHYIINCSI